MTILDREIASRMKKSGLNSILTSILSDKEEIHDAISNRKGSWREAIQGIKIAVSQGIRVSTNMVLLQTNFDRIFETAKLLKDLGVQFTVKSSNIKELKNIKTTCASLVKQNALLKARDVACKVKKGIVIGADTLVYGGDKKIIGKPQKDNPYQNMMQKFAAEIKNAIGGPIQSLEAEIKKLYKRRRRGGVE